MNTEFSKNCLSIGMTIVLSIFCSSPSAEAAPLIGDSSAYGTFVDLTIHSDSSLSTLLTSASVGPTPTVSGSAPAPYNSTDSQASASASGSLDIAGLGSVELIDFDTGVLDVQAQSDVTGADVSSTTSADATVNNVMLDITSVSDSLTLSSLVTLDATQIDAMAQVSGQSGALADAGSSTLTGTAGDSSNQALLTVLGTQFLLEANPAPNTMFTIDSSLGGSLASFQGSIDVFLNEQLSTGNGSTSQDLEVNALRLSFNDVGIGLGSTASVLNGDVIVSNAQANMAAVPEPTSTFLVSGGLLGMAFAGRRRRRQQALAS